MDVKKTEIPPREYFWKLHEEFLFGEIWQRPGLSRRDRSLVTIGLLAGLRNTMPLKSHIGRGLDHGLTKEEIEEACLHLTFYGGWPTAALAFQVANEVFAERAKKNAAPGKPA